MVSSDNYVIEDMDAALNEAARSYFDELVEDCEYEKLFTILCLDKDYLKSMIRISLEASIDDIAFLNKFFVVVEDEIKSHIKANWLYMHDLKRYMEPLR